MNLDSDFNYKYSSTDQLSGAQIAMNPLHSHIHRGKAFRYIQAIAVLANDGFMYFEITPSLTKNVHLKDIGLWISEGPVLIDLLKNLTTFTTGSTAIVGKNLNDNNYGDTGLPIPSEAVMKSDPTFTGGDSMFGDAFRFGVNGLGAQVNESFISDEIETLLAAGKGPYILTIQNKSGGNINVSGRLIWYE